MQTKIDLDRNMKGEDAKRWLNERLQRKGFFLFLDDVGEEGTKLMEATSSRLL